MFSAGQDGFTRRARAAVIESADGIAKDWFWFTSLNNEAPRVDTLMVLP